MTKYIDKVTVHPINKITVFQKILKSNFEITEVQGTVPGDYQFVEFIGHDVDYGDVFKAWDSDNLGFTIFFGIRGDEFSK